MLAVSVWDVFKTQAASLAAVRPYCHARDHARLAYICRNVYGGTDDLPQRVERLHSEPGNHLLAACTGGEGGQLDALLCCQERGDVLWLFGARTAEELRGHGLAGLLLAEAESLARALLGAAALLSITVPANETMRRLFARRGLRQQRRVVAWPETPVALEAHQRMVAAAPQAQLGQQAPGQQHHVQSFLQALPAAAAVANNPAARALLPRWRRCSSPEELQAALLRLRRADPQRQQQRHAVDDDGSSAALGAEAAAASHSLAAATQPAAGADDGAAQRRQVAAASQAAAAAAACTSAPATAAAAHGQEAVAAADEAGHVCARLPPNSCAFHWVPGEYELLPAGGPEMQQLVQQGAVWLLQAACHDSRGAADGAGAAAEAEAAEAAEAVLVCFGPGFRGMRHAGVAAGSAAALESALLLASAVADPQCCRFYIDACGFDHPLLWASTGGPRIDILPFFKQLDA